MHKAWQRLSHVNKTYDLPKQDTEGRWPLAFAQEVAEDLKALLEPACEPKYCVIAGSIRRQQPTVGDIELLCVPKFETHINLFGDVVRDRDCLDSYIKSSGLFDMRKNVNGSYTYGEKNKLLIHKPTGIAVDIFTTDTLNWGMSLLVRTGSASFCKLVMSEFLRLHMRGHAYPKGGQGGITLANGTEIDCPDEETVFRYLRWNWIEPEKRV